MSSEQPLTAGESAQPQWVVTCCASWFQSKCTPQVRFKLTATICDDSRGGTVKRAIQPLMKVWATSFAMMPETGRASGNMSTHVRRYVNPREGGSGPTRAMCTVSNLPRRGKRREWGDCVLLNFYHLLLSTGNVFFSIRYMVSRIQGFV